MSYSPPIWITTMRFTWSCPLRYLGTSAGTKNLCSMNCISYQYASRFNSRYQCIWKPSWFKTKLFPVISTHPLDWSREARNRVPSCWKTAFFFHVIYPVEHHLTRLVSTCFAMKPGAQIVCLTLFLDYIERGVLWVVLLPFCAINVISKFDCF